MPEDGANLLLLSPRRNAHLSRCLARQPTATTRNKPCRGDQGVAALATQRKTTVTKLTSVTDAAAGR